MSAEVPKLLSIGIKAEVSRPLIDQSTTASLRSNAASSGNERVSRMRVSVSMSCLIFQVRSSAPTTQGFTSPVSIGGKTTFSSSPPFQKG